MIYPATPQWNQDWATPACLLFSPYRCSSQSVIAYSVSSARNTTPSCPSGLSSLKASCHRYFLDLRLSPSCCKVILLAETPVCFIYTCMTVLPTLYCGFFLVHSSPALRPGTGATWLVSGTWWSFHRMAAKKMALAWLISRPSYLVCFLLSHSIIFVQFKVKKGELFSIFKALDSNN